MTALARSLRPALAALGARLARNVSSYAARLKQVPRDRLRVAPDRAAITVVSALAIIVLAGLALDPTVNGLPQSLPRPVYAFFQWATRFGKSDWLLIPSGVIVIAVALGDWRRVTPVLAAAWSEIAAFAASVFVAVAVSGLITDIIKPIVGRSRPHLAGDAVFQFTPFYLGGYSYYSFPSGHGTTMAAIAAIVTAAIVGRWRVALLVAAGIVAVSRVMIGAHYPSDVVGGMLIGGTVGWIVLRVMAEARIGFEIDGKGAIRRRDAGLRALRRRKSLAALLPALITALFRRY